MRALYSLHHTTCFCSHREMNMRVILLCLIVVFLASACAPAATRAPIPAQPPAATPAPTAVPPIKPPATIEPTVAQPTSTATTETRPAGAVPVKTWVETKGFRKSEAKYFVATGRPQLVEFFAFW